MEEIIDEKFTANADGVQLWENGPYWAECNVGASKPEESGYYFWWGDTVGSKRNASNDGWVSVATGEVFKFRHDNCPIYENENDVVDKTGRHSVGTFQESFYAKTNAVLESEGFIDKTGHLTPAHDAATAHLGASWHMPTETEIMAMHKNCTTQWVKRNGVLGCLVTGKGTYSSRSIFLPAAGYAGGPGLHYFGMYGFYWSSMLDSIGAGNLRFDESHFNGVHNHRVYGQPVRAVRQGR